MSCYEITDNVLNFLNLVAVIGLALGGFNIWKKQQILIEKHNLARELLKSVHLLRKRVEYLRSPFMSAGEIALGFKTFDDLPNDLDIRQKQDLGEVGAYFERWKGIAEIGSEFETLKVEARVVFGEEAENVFNGLDKIIRDIKIAIIMYADYKKALVYESIVPITDEQLKHYMKDLMQGYSAIDSEEDPIDKRLSKEIKDIEDFLQKFLKLRDNK
ncbi:hypothetical protein [Pelolinea submarina]|uniref:Uncharacterized protein n=1 Tax=Pelolinea submarina TaxID=913107 RepID=A0A3E0AHM2_9CHLR|nr:hypothetical protein [Pelolinea submarina]REG11141.1 hypothetical protein DFR64_1018 [Pelolinea submarina]